MKTVLILGCGWVGEEFALYMLNKGFSIYACTTSEEKAERLSTVGISSFVHNFDDESTVNETLPVSFDYVLTSVPATTRLTVEQVDNRFANVTTFLKGIQFSKHIFLSSIGVYPDVDAVFTEEYMVESNQNLARAENRMLEIAGTKVYRLGGLFGKNRIFAKYFENRVCSTGNQLANFVHLDDVVELICQGFERDLKSSIYTIVAPEHPTKKEVIIASASKYGFQLPSAWEPQDSFQKLVDSSKIVDELGYAFKYPSPLNF